MSHLAESLFNLAIGVLALIGFMYLLIGAINLAFGRFGNDTSLRDDSAADGDSTPDPRVDLL